jgi:ribosomal protein L7/L12
MYAEIVDLIKAGAVIQSIKHYRSEMKINLDTDVSLRESKDYVDAIRDNLKQQGVTK